MLIVLNQEERLLNPTQKGSAVLSKYVLDWIMHLLFVHDDSDVGAHSLCVEVPPLKDATWLGCKGERVHPCLTEMCFGES